LNISKTVCKKINGELKEQTKPKLGRSAMYAVVDGLAGLVNAR